MDFLNDTSFDKTQVQESIDMDKVDKIVNRLKAKYEKQGITEGVNTGNLKELRSIIAEGKRAKIEVLRPEDLRISYNPTIKR